MSLAADEPSLQVSYLKNQSIMILLGIDQNMTTFECSQFCVYIMTDEQHSLLYTGRTGNLKRRVAQHRSGNGGVFTRRYNLIKLVYYEIVEDVQSARLREKQIKRSSKKHRVSLIEKLNPEWNDLYEIVNKR